MSLIQTQVHIDGDKLVFERKTSMERLKRMADVCRAMQNEGLHGSPDLPLYANVDGALIEAYCNNNGITFADFMRDQVHVKRFLNDPAIAHFRVKPGRV